MEDNLGRQVATRVDLSPGGNAVQAFLDIVAPDHVTMDEVRDALHQLRRDPVTSRQREQWGLVVMEFDGGWQFNLSDDSAQRLLQAFPDVQTARVNVPYAVADDFRRMYGDLYPYAVEWVTSKPRSELLRLGGVRIVHDEQTVWEWPRARKAD